MCRPQPKRARAADAGGAGAVSASESEASSPSSGAAAAGIGGEETAASRVLSHDLLLKEVLAFAAGQGPGRLDAARAVSRLWRAAVESPELQRAFLLGRWPGLAPFLRASLDRRAPAQSPPPATDASAGAAPTPLAPFLHFATTSATRRAEEERRLAERFRGAALQIEILHPDHAAPIAQGNVAIADCLARSDGGSSGSFLDQAYALHLTDAARGLPLGEWGRCRAALTWGGVAVWEARLGLDEMERVGAGARQSGGGCGCSCPGPRRGLEAQAEHGEGEERWEVSCSGAGGFRPRIAGVVEGHGRDDGDDGEEEGDGGSAEVCFELVLGCSLAVGAHEQEETRLRAAVPSRVWRAEMMLCAEDGAWALPSPYALLKALALCDTAVRQQREREASSAVDEEEGAALRRLRARFRGAWVLVEEFSPQSGPEQPPQSSAAGGKGLLPAAPATPVLMRFHLSPLLQPGSDAPPALFATAAAAPFLPTTAAAAAKEGKRDPSPSRHRVWLLDMRTGRPVVLADSGPLGARWQLLLLPVGHALGWRVDDSGKGVRLLPYVVGPDASAAALVEERALPPFAGLRDVLACLEVCVAGVPADETGVGVYVGTEGVRVV